MPILDLQSMWFPTLPRTTLFLRNVPFVMMNDSSFLRSRQEWIARETLCLTHANDWIELEPKLD